MPVIESPTDPAPNVEGDLRRPLAALRVTIRSALPDAVERVDFGNRLIAFGRSTRMGGLPFAIIAHETWVNLQLAARPEG